LTSWPLASAVARTSCRSWSGAVGADARRPAVRPRRSCIQRDHSTAGTAIHSPMGCGNAFSSSSELMEETAEKITSTCPGLLIVADDGECSRWIRHRWPGRPVRTMTVAWSTSTRRTPVGWPGELHPGSHRSQREPLGSPGSGMIAQCNGALSAKASRITRGSSPKVIDGSRFPTPHRPPCGRHPSELRADAVRPTRPTVADSDATAICPHPARSAAPQPLVGVGGCA
jgi:hypothetical protein